MHDSKLLKKLIGKSLSEAERMVRDEFLEPYPIPEGVAMTMEAKPDTVVLSYNTDKKITHAGAGDPLQWTNS